MAASSSTTSSSPRWLSSSSAADRSPEKHPSDREPDLAVRRALRAPNATTLPVGDEIGEHMPSVLVTGAGRGIGLAITEHMSGRGWDVYATARSNSAVLAAATTST